MNGLCLANEQCLSQAAVLPKRDGFKMTSKRTQRRAQDVGQESNGSKIICLHVLRRLLVKERANTNEASMRMTTLLTMVPKVQRKADGEGRKRAVRTMSRRCQVHESMLFVCIAFLEQCRGQCPRICSHSRLAQFFKT